MKKIIPMDLHNKLEAAGIPIHGVSEDGRIDFKDATKEQQDQAAQIVADYDQDEVDAAKIDLQPVTLEDINSAKTVSDLKTLLIRLHNIKG
jgi:hypothetical protein